MITQHPFNYIVEVDLTLLKLLRCLLYHHNFDDEVSIAYFGGVCEFLLFMEFKYLKRGFAFGLSDHKVDKEVVGEVLRSIVLIIYAQFHHFTIDYN